MARLYRCPGAAEHGSALPVSRRSRAWLGSTDVPEQPSMARLYRCPGAAEHGSALPMSRSSRAWLGSTGVQEQPSMARLYRCPGAAGHGSALSVHQAQRSAGLFCGRGGGSAGHGPALPTRSRQQPGRGAEPGSRRVPAGVQGARPVGVLERWGSWGFSRPTVGSTPSAGCGLPVRWRKRVLARVGGARRGGKSQTGTALAPLPPSSRGSVPCPI